MIFSKQSTCLCVSLKHAMAKRNNAILVDIVEPTVYSVLLKRINF